MAQPRRPALHPPAGGLRWVAAGRRYLGALDPATRGWGIVAGGNVVRLGLGVVSSVLLARALGPAGFGLFAVLGAVANVTGAVADLGVTAAAVQRVAAVWAVDPPAARRRGAAFFWLRAGLLAPFLVAASVLTALLAGPLALPAWWRLLPLVYLGVAATALSSAVSALLQAAGRFGRYALVALTNAVLTVALALALSLAGRLTIVSALAVLGSGTALAAFAAGYRLLPAALRTGLPGWAVLRQEGAHLLRLGRWLCLAAVLAMLTGRLDLFLVGHWSGAAAVGVYALALNLATKLDVANQSLSTVLLPAAAALGDRPALRRYLRQGLLRSAAISLAVLPLFPLAGLAIPLFYGAAYAPAVGLFRLLLGVAIVDLFATPLLLLPYRADRPRVLAAADALRATVLLVAGAALIPVHGPAGAAAARLASRLAGAAFVAAALRRRAGIEG